MTRPSHHRPDGGFRAPWLSDGEARRGLGALLRWQWQRLTSPPAPDPPPADFPTSAPTPALHRAAPGEIRATWLGHATFLVQVGPVTVLTDPVFSHRASPLRFAGPARYLPPALDIGALPPLDAVILSHDHYDHLDEQSVTALHRRFGEALTWVTPLGYREWFASRSVERVVELDWWDSVEVGGEGGTGMEITAAPAQHWTRRGLATNRRLWASFGLRGAHGSVYFGGDSGYFPGYAEIGARLGPFDLTLLPIGAYEPRWFMRPSHMNPEEAVRAYGDLGARGAFVGMHWGTFRLTDEPPLEPPARARAAWRRAGLPDADYREPGIGGTVALRVGGRSAAGNGAPTGPTG